MTRRLSMLSRRAGRDRGPRARGLSPRFLAALALPAALAPVAAPDENSHLSRKPAQIAFDIPQLFSVPTMAASASAVPVLATSTLNWSGYGLAGRRFTGVTGTFNVPTPLNWTSCLEETAVWVGVDGLRNHDLLQAGIAETGFTASSTNTPILMPPSAFSGFVCLGRAQVYAWWEDLPSAPERVDLPVKAGDSVTVSLFKMSPGWWALAVHDLSDRKSFLLAQPYSGPQTSVEWVVEAPQIMGVTRGPMPFTTVHFHDLGAQGETRDLERFSLRPGPGLTSGPDVVASTAQLMRSGFAVHLTRSKG